MTKGDNFIEQFHKNLRGSEISTVLDYVTDLLSQYETILSFVSEYFEQLDSTHDKIETMRICGIAKNEYATMSNKEFEMMFLREKTKALMNVINSEPELRTFIKKVHMGMKYNKNSKQIGLKLDVSDTSAKDILINYYKLKTLKEKLESQLRIYR